MATAAEQKVLDDKKAADDKKAGEQMAADQRAAAADLNKEPVIVVGRPGGVFSISGEGFGPSGGELSIGGRKIETTRWDQNQIRGTLPMGVKGPVLLRTSSGDRTGVYPHVYPVVTTTTTTVTRDVR